MLLDKAIIEKHLMEINLEQLEKSFTGVCLMANNSVWVLVSFNFRMKRFDGILVIKNELIDSYSIWKKKYLKIDNDSLSNFQFSSKIASQDTLISILKKTYEKEIISIWVKQDTQSYYIGKVKELNNEFLLIDIITANKILIKNEKIMINDILMFGLKSKIEIAFNKYFPSSD